MEEMEAQARFSTDTATLAIFDPERLSNRVDDDSDWWCDDELSEVNEVRQGVAALVSLGGDGVYTARLTDGELTQDERDYAAELVEKLGVEVVSGKLFVGPGECLPGGGTGLDSDDGALVELDNGEYLVDVYAIGWHDAARWWSEDGVAPDDAPADFVILLRRRSTPFREVDSEPAFEGWVDEFLFESSTRQIGPQPGMLITTTVRKGGSGGLSLKDCGPCDYSATLTDFSDVAWKDTIRFEVVSVDHDAEEMVGTFVEKVEGS